MTRRVRPRAALALVPALVALILAAVLPGPAIAQGADDGAAPGALEADAPAILVADSVYISPDRQLVAEGNVEVFRGDVRLRARRITYDRDRDRLIIDGPIRIDQDGSVTVLADAADLDGDLQNGILTGARLVFEDQLQLAALQMSRVEGRYSQLYKTAVTSCNVCGDRPPLWSIRASRIIHDQDERQLYFEDAQFRLYGVPVFYLPRLRLPDPTLDRATGFLLPTVRTTNLLQTGLRLPYFITLGDHRDLTLAPYISPKTRTLDFRYRQAFRRGNMIFEGALTDDDIVPGELRGYLFGLGYFELDNHFVVDFDLKAASDNGYLVDYGLPDLDRLQSEILLSRSRRDSVLATSAVNFTSLRDSEDQALLPSIMLDAAGQQRIALAGGEARIGYDLHSHTRTSNIDQLGRDVARGTLDMNWRDTWTLGPGVRLQGELGLAADQFFTDHDSTVPSQVFRTAPRAALTASYPVSRIAGNGGSEILEPFAQIGWVHVSNQDNANDESGFVEFDQGNLLDLSRFSAPDRREDGLAFVYGVNWGHYAPAGWQVIGSMGQVLRDQAQEDFTVSSGLSGTASDVLVAGQLRTANGLSLTARGLVGDSLSFTKAEIRGDWYGDRVALASTYLWLGEDKVEQRLTPSSEFYFDGRYDVTRNWTTLANLRYDIAQSQATRAGFGVGWRNECVEFAVTVNRRFTSSLSVEPTTDFSFTIGILGFAAEAGTETYRRACNKT
jgi:LPS-assembly protein